MLKLLLVDDEYIVLKGLEIVLRDQKEVSLEIRTAIDAVDAYEKAEGWTPDVIIADINMPEIDGLTMLERLSVTIPLCRFIIVSGYEENEYLKRALKLHVDDYLLKPVDKLYFLPGPGKLRAAWPAILNRYSFFPRITGVSSSLIIP